MGFKRFIYIPFLLLLLAPPIWGQYFVENKGQWFGPASFRYHFAGGEVWLSPDEVRVHLMDPHGAALALFEHEHHSQDEVQHSSTQAGHVYGMKWLGANTIKDFRPKKELPQKFNFFLGEDSSRWATNVRAYRQLQAELYKDIYIHYEILPSDLLKYSLHLSPGANPRNLALQYTAADSLYLYEGQLYVETSVGRVIESAPYAYQWINGKRVEVACSYQLEGEVLRFSLGSYDKEVELIIDPTLTFSTYIASGAQVFGFTATYGKLGEAYAGGIAFGSTGSFPTVGAYDSTYNGGGVDMVLNKTSANGQILQYSTFLGGNRGEMPYSIIEGQDGSLFILGNTGSDNFPTSATSYVDTFSGGPGFAYASANYSRGTDLVISRLGPNGDVLMASTYMGGTGEDGINQVYPLGSTNDQFRGEITLDSNNTVYVAAQSRSSDFPTTPGAAQTNIGGMVDGVIFSLDQNLSQLRFSTFHGGNNNDGAFSLRYLNDTLFVVGSTQSGDMPVTAGVGQSTKAGGVDGFLASFNASTGARIASTFTGAPQDDYIFFNDVDESGYVFVFGITESSLPITNPNFIKGGSGRLFIQQYNRSFTQLKRSTTFGSSTQNAPLSPSAFERDYCGNILLSAWGTTAGYPVTPDALKSNSADRDFYFAIIDASWTKFNYATHYGAVNSQSGYGEHVDGGTSRFDPNGTIYQAICASCQEGSNFPTSPNVHGPTKGLPSSQLCNMAVVKFATNSALVQAEVVPRKDTVCIGQRVELLDSSINADYFEFTYPDGSTFNTDTMPFPLISQTGVNLFKVIARDTSCGSSDSTLIEVFGLDVNNFATMSAEYDSCQTSSDPFTVKFSSQTAPGFATKWKFGDGQQSSLANPSHTYSLPGIYEVELIVTGGACAGLSSMTLTVVINAQEPLDLEIEENDCADEPLQLNALGRGYQDYQWRFSNGSSARGLNVNPPGGLSEGRVWLVAIDTLCNRTDSISRDFKKSLRDVQLIFPNVFSPNGDGLNDYFGPSLPQGISPNDLNNYSLQIFNRWGQAVYSTQNLSDKWDGREDLEILAPGVYFYLVNYNNNCGETTGFKGFVHLIR